MAGPTELRPQQLDRSDGLRRQRRQEGQTRRMAQRSTRRGPENQECLPRLERAIAAWTGSANSIQASGRAKAAPIRPDTRKHLNLRALPSETLLHPKGRPHTDIRIRIGRKRTSSRSGRRIGEPGSCDSTRAPVCSLYVHGGRMAGKFLGRDGKYHPVGSFLGEDGKYHPKGYFLGQDGRYHPPGSFLGQDGKYHRRGESLRSDGRYHPAGHFLGQDGKHHPPGSFLGQDGKYHPEGAFLGQDGRYHPSGCFLGQDGRYHLAGSFLGQDGRYHLPGSFLGSDGKYHPKGSFVGAHGRYEEPAGAAELEARNQRGMDC